MPEQTKTEADREYKARHLHAYDKRLQHVPLDIVRLIPAVAENAGNVFWETVVSKLQKDVYAGDLPPLAAQTFEDALIEAVVAWVGYNYVHPVDLLVRAILRIRPDWFPNMTNQALHLSLSKNSGGTLGTVKHYEISIAYDDVTEWWIGRVKPHSDRPQEWVVVDVSDWNEPVDQLARRISEEIVAQLVHFGY